MLCRDAGAREGGPVIEHVKHASRHASDRRPLRGPRYARPSDLDVSVKRSPAREDAPEPASWFPLVAVTGPATNRRSVRPLPSRPAVVVRRSPAREEAPDPVSWFPLAELEALLEPERLVPEGPSPTPVGAPPASLDVLPTPTPTPAPAPSAPTRSDIQRDRRRRRARHRARLAVVGAGLGIGLLFTKVVAPEGDPPAPTAEPMRALADDPVDALTAAADAERAANAAEAARVAAATAPPPPPPLPNEAIWEEMAVCETGGNWSHYGPTWSGGLGIYRGTWQEFGGSEFAPLPSQATREQQIIVAERIRARHGFSAWGCADNIGVS